MTCQCEEVASPFPEPATHTISFIKEIRPILEKNCVLCHGGTQKLGGLQINTRDELLKGGASGPVVIIGKSEESYLIQLVAGKVPGKIMPMTGTRLTAEEIGLLRAWIDQELVWQPGFSFSSPTSGKASIAMSQPEIPDPASDTPLTNPIDRFVWAYFEKHTITPLEMVDDRTFARRAYLDITGLLPTAVQLQSFLDDRNSGKRERLVKQLLNDRKAYTEHWLTFWNDILRNEYRGTGFIDGGRKQITDWLYQSLMENKPYNQMVAELIDPVTGSEGFMKGIIWRGVVNSSQTPEMQAAQNLSQVFLGINLKCASCHDSFINDWKLADSYGLASVFAERPLELVRCDSPTGVTATVQFIYPELGQIDAGVPAAQRREQLAAILTSKENGLFARTIVNRIWAKLMGCGFIEPVDDMSAPSWNNDLLDWLARDFIISGYDLQHLLTAIITSRTYQLPAVDRVDGHPEDYVFTGPLVRRMSAEQFVDAVSSITGTWQLMPANFFKPDGRDQGGQAPRSWHEQETLRFAGGTISSGSVVIDIDVTGATVLRLTVADNQDGRIPNTVLWAEPRLMGSYGERSLLDFPWRSVTTTNASIPQRRLPDEGPYTIGESSFTSGIEIHSQSQLIYEIPEGTTRFQTTVGLYKAQLTEEGKFPQIEVNILSDDSRLRAALVHSDPLTQALGRPNREQVVTHRDSLATTLQALEMSNGKTLNRMIQQGARWWTEQTTESPTATIAQIYREALGREPEPKELSIAEELVGQPIQPEGVADLLWSVTMLPEFQLIY